MLVPNRAEARPHDVTVEAAQAEEEPQLAGGSLVRAGLGCERRQEGEGDREQDERRFHTISAGVGRTVSALN